MDYNQIEHQGYTYHKLYISCPVCYNNGKMVPQSYWQHKDCGGAMYIGDDAHYYCHQCFANSHVYHWDYGCPEHMRDANYNFLTINSACPVSMAFVGEMIPIVGVAWLQKFLSSLD